jgi:ATP-dependent DNA helicase RecG
VETERILDMPPMSRSDGLASFMRRIGYSEERGSGIDKIVESIERNILPAPEFRTMGNFTRVVLFGPRPFAEMNRGERIRAVYLHTCLHHVSNRVTNNATIFERFGFDNVTKASRLLADAVDDGRVRVRNPELGRRYADYVLYWA